MSNEQGVYNIYSAHYQYFQISSTIQITVKTTN